jgi:mono/diheme cytochrome c family protein
MRRLISAATMERSRLRALAKILLAIVVLCVVVVAGLYAFAYRPAIAKREGAPQTFPPQQVNAGARLATAGNCTACHTRPDGPPYAGGLPIPTSFGTIYSSNITPDPDAGIGSWTLEAFTRAMREGTARGGTQLYPAFPYDHYTKLKDEDIAAIYAYIMTRDPVPERPPRTALRFPYNIRPLMAGWKLMFLDKARFEPDQQKGEDWNRGAYLVQALGHCGECHTPRNALGGPKSDRFLAGAKLADGATASNLTPTRLKRYSDAELKEIMQTGNYPDGDVIGETMAEVVKNTTSQLTAADLDALIAYLRSLPALPDEPK